MITGLTAITGGWFFLGVGGNDARRIITAIIHKRLHYLDKDADGLRLFCEEFQKRMSPESIEKAEWLGIFQPVYSFTNFFALMPGFKTIQDFEERVVTQYLLSSDFFVKGFNLLQQVRYLRYYDPYTSPCTNPFAKFTASS